MTDITLQRGDVVGCFFGNDWTYLILLEVRAEDADAWDLLVDVEIKALRLRTLWRASEQDMERRMSFSGGQRNGSFSIQQLADEARKKLDLDA